MGVQLWSQLTRRCCRTNFPLRSKFAAERGVRSLWRNMNRIPHEFDLAGMVGQPLSQVCIDQYQVQLSFTNARIQGGGALSLETDGVPTKLFDGAWLTSQGLEVLIGEAVAAWSRRDDFHFTLKFQSGVELVFRTQEGPYEDFTVHLANDAFWVL